MVNSPYVVVRAFTLNRAARAASLLCLLAKSLNDSTVSYLVSPELTGVAAVATEQSRTQQKMAWDNVAGGLQRNPPFKY